MNWIIAFFISAGLLIIFIVLFAKEKKNSADLYSEKSKLSSKLYSDMREKQQEIDKLQSEYVRKLVALESQVDKLDSLNKNREEALKKIFTDNLQAFPYLAGIMADYMTYDLKILAKSLEWGDNVQRKKKVAAIYELRNETRQQLEQYKLASYELDYLLQLFPSLEDIIDESFHDLPKDMLSIPEHDPVQDYLSKEEWLSLSETERNQLALDRYIQSHDKTKWQIGRDYELYVGHVYAEKGYHIEYFGANMGLEDLGRDLLCTKDDETLIIQCKYWSKEKTIHEKHIFQLYGTSISYCIEHGIPTRNIRPIFITNTKLSPMAVKVAELLTVNVISGFETGQFPRIKCNVGRDEYGNKTYIYHLPMDQQYDILKMSNPGCRFAYTVEEAESYGFRRAFKWHGNN